VSSALRYRAQAPLVDRILQEVGMDGASLAGLVASVSPVAPIAALPHDDRPDLLKTKRESRRRAS